VLESDFKVYVAKSRPQVKTLLRQLDRAPQLALIDLGLPPTPHRPDEGFHLVTELIAHSPEMKIVVLSGQSDETNARHARALGAVDFVHKPCEPDALRALLKRALEIQGAEASGPAEGGLLGRSVCVEKLRQQIIQFANAPFPVLIEGESGSGKELVARSLHLTSHRAARPFLALNCAAISPTLVEPTLFGYAKGAFTGATTSRAGYFEDANESTLFLDEIGELPLELQAKLLRVLENGEFQRVGETQSRVSNARVVAATNRDMRQEIRGGRFRADLYHRLSVFTLAVPPLRELGQDKVLLLDHFRDFYARQAGVEHFQLDARAMALWLKYGFAGNIRELRNIVYRLSCLAGQTADLEHLPVDIRPAAPAAEVAEPVPAPAAPEAASAGALSEAKRVASDRAEREFLERGLQEVGGVVTELARRWDMNRSHVQTLLKKHGIRSKDCRLGHGAPRTA